MSLSAGVLLEFFRLCAQRGPSSSSFPLHGKHRPPPPLCSAPSGVRKGVTGALEWRPP